MAGIAVSVVDRLNRAASASAARGLIVTVIVIATGDRARIARNLVLSSQAAGDHRVG